VKAIQWETPSRRLGAPANWDHERDGICHTLEILDVDVSGSNFMVSAWQPTEAEMKRLQEGKPLLLWIQGRSHPVVMVSIGGDE
jgi:hypothetical protein